MGRPRLPPGEATEALHVWVYARGVVLSALRSEANRRGVTINAALNEIVRPALEAWYGAKVSSQPGR